MIISKLIKDDVVYYQLHAEQSINWAITNESGLGILEEMLTISTLDRVFNDVNESKSSNVVLDFQNLLSIQSNLTVQIIALKEKVKSLTLTNIHEDIIEKLNLESFKTNSNNLIIDNTFKIFYLTVDEKILLADYNDVFITKFCDYLKICTIDNIEDNKPINYSSSVYLNKYIDVKKMITQDNFFFLNCIYHLSIKTKKHFDISSKNKPTLICQNLNSTYLASVLSSFLNLDILILDKIGPINNIYSTLSNKIESNKHYLIVSDVVCLGTEIKISKGIVNFLGGKYIGNVSIIRVETLNPLQKKYTDSECVFEITRENNPIDFQILTNLNI